MIALATIGLIVAWGATGPLAREAPTSTGPSAGPGHRQPLPELGVAAARSFAARPPAAVAPRFHGSVAPIDSATRTDLGTSWRPGCPVPIGELRLLTLSFWGFDDAAHRGQLIVHRRYANDVLVVFRTLFEARFPIRKMEIVHEYAGDRYDGHTDRPADDDTAAFNCREALGSPGVWSQHAYGSAVDVNPVENPYVSQTGEIVPKEGRAFADRSRWTTGTISPDGVAVRAFAAIGWSWGGNWHSIRDYMHFSATGR
jgi:hypothetical protein